MSAFAGDIIDIYAGGHLDDSSKSWLQQQSEVIRSTASGAAAAFFDQARNLYQMISDIDATQILRNLLAKKTDAWRGNDIYAMQTIEQFQTAGPVMQRWILANPVVRQAYLNQEIEGYSGQYTNYHGDAIGVQHYDYRRVMDGMVTATPEQWGYTDYIDLIPEGERELTLFEKVDILRTWNNIVACIDAGESDPTSPMGNPL